MKIGDLVRRGSTYKPEWRKEVALVVDVRDFVHKAGDNHTAIKLLWSNGNYDPQLNIRGAYCPEIWYPINLFEIVQE